MKYSRNIIGLDLMIPQKPRPPSPFIKIYDAFMEPAICDRLVDFYEKNKEFAVPNKTVGDIQTEKAWAAKNIKKKSITARQSIGLTIDQLIAKDPQNAEYREIYDIIYKHYDTAIKKYLHEIRQPGFAGIPAGSTSAPGLVNASNFDDEHYFITKYNQGDGFYGWHCDRGLVVKNGHHTGNRYLSGILYLNDVEVGGETEFLSDHFKVKAKKGRLLLFPSGWTYIHRGIKPSSGNKYICNNFFSFYGNPAPTPAAAPTPEPAAAPTPEPAPTSLSSQLSKNLRQKREAAPTPPPSPPPSPPPRRPPPPAPTCAGMFTQHASPETAAAHDYASKPTNFFFD